ncbi:metallophosphoesterase [Pedosphaera parvula]|uniref:Calcineurin-like phosphoesterase domain-containing protein n=1 Tax=Pedosphaera parvula (strain Ellin514) TaxID=320771 RepID=B9XPI4_PEDPL|nr:metallophosphoesterase [Pedosphaera parvula]EEF58212.1 hypothetical protein Cflav_PD1412 [Pedosphaera parvula Ellin514]
MTLPRQIRLLTVTDLHRSAYRCNALVQAIRQHEPDIVAFVDDFLGSDKHGLDLHTINETARIISELPARHLLFTRGNHEDSQGQEFVFAWPMKKRSLIALHGTAITLGPLVIVGFHVLSAGTSPSAKHCQNRETNLPTTMLSQGANRCLPPMSGSRD